MKMSLTAALLHRLVLLFVSPVWQFLPASGSARLASACTPCGPRRGGLLPAALLCRHGAHVAGGARRIPGAPPARGAGHRRGAPRASRLPHQLCASRGALSACAGRVPATYWLLMSGHVVSAPPDYPMTSKNEASGAMFRSAAAKLRACRSALLREAPRRCVPHLPCVGGQQNRSAPLRRLPQSAAGSKRARDAPQHCLTPGRPASAGGGAGGRHGGATRGRAGPPALCRAGRARGQVRTIPAARPRPRCGMRKRPACLTVRAHPPKPQAPTLARARVTVPSAILTSRRQ